MADETAFWATQLAECVEENASKAKPGWWLSVGAPCFSRGERRFSVAEESRFDQSGFSPGFHWPV